MRHNCYVKLILHVCSMINFLLRLFHSVYGIPLTVNGGELIAENFYLLRLFYSVYGIPLTVNGGELIAENFYRTSSSLEELCGKATRISVGNTFLQSHMIGWTASRIFFLAMGRSQKHIKQR